MRKISFIPYVVAACVVAACGDKTKSSDANAAEVRNPTPEATSAATPAEPVVTGPVSFETAKAAFTDKRYDESVRLFTSYTAEHPDNVWGYYLLGLSAWKAGDRDGAVKALRVAIEKDSTHLKSRINLSRVLIEQGKAQDALPLVEATLKIDSTSNEVYRVLGRVRDELGDPTGAGDAFKRAIVLDPSDAWAINDFGWLAIGRHAYSEALGPLARAVEIDSTVATFQNNLGVALEGSGHLVQAASAYRSALSIDSTYRKASANLSRVERMKPDSAVGPVDLNGLAREFGEQVKTWK